jgi:hypothetical protein
MSETNSKLVCPVMSTHGKKVTCVRENCAWYIKYQSVIDSIEGGCALVLFARKVMEDSHES